MEDDRDSAILAEEDDATVLAIAAGIRSAARWTMDSDGRGRKTFDAVDFQILYTPKR